MLFGALLVIILDIYFTLSASLHEDSFWPFSSGRCISDLALEFFRRRDLNMFLSTTLRQKIANDFRYWR